MKQNKTFIQIHQSVPNVPFTWFQLSQSSFILLDFRCNEGAEMWNRFRTMEEKCHCHFITRRRRGRTKARQQMWTGDTEFDQEDIKTSLNTH